MDKIDQICRTLHIAGNAHLFLVNIAVVSGSGCRRHRRRACVQVCQMSE
jgi:hypothetical protein